MKRFAKHLAVGLILVTVVAIAAVSFSGLLGVSTSHEDVGVLWRSNAVSAPREEVSVLWRSFAVPPAPAGDVAVLWRSNVVASPQQDVAVLWRASCSA